MSLGAEECPTTAERITTAVTPVLYEIVREREAVMMAAARERDTLRALLDRANTATFRYGPDRVVILNCDHCGKAITRICAGDSPHTVLTALHGHQCPGETASAEGEQ